jgi:hypothetical protein
MAIYLIIMPFKDLCAVNIDSNVYTVIILSTFADCLLHKALTKRCLWVLYFAMETAEIID